MARSLPFTCGLWLMNKRLAHGGAAVRNVRTEGISKREEIEDGDHDSGTDYGDGG
ncbi:hypothetical protein J6TS7_12330 [Paenibacillus dendritiformis]|nr:hypothetical protein J6TS7_12330 [Paenibacillus dendritiformis]